MMQQSRRSNPANMFIFMGDDRRVSGNTEYGRRFVDEVKCVPLP